MEKIKIDTEKKKGNSELSDQIAYWIIIALIFLLPLLFSPWAVVSFAYSKAILVSVAVLLLSFFLIFRIFKKQETVVTFHPVFVSLLVIPIIYFLSSFFSVSKESSFIGHGYEIGTASFTLILVLLTFFIAAYTNTKQKIFSAYLAFGASVALLLLFHTFRLFFGAGFLSLGIFTDATSNTIGKWNDLGVVSGISLILSLISLELLSLSRAIKSTLYIILILSLLVLSVINFPILEIGGFNVSIFAVIGIISLLFFAYVISFKRVKAADMEDNDEKRFPTASLIVFIISVLMTLAMSPIASFTSNHFKISEIDARPSWGSTALIAKGSLAQKPIVGAGPNEFVYEWLLHKPVVINNTDLWETDFNNGVGYVPSSIVETGVLGFLAWLAFLGCFVWFGVKVLFSKNKDPFSHYLILSSFLVASFLWLIHILYMPSIVTLALAFIWTGLFLGSMLEAGKIKEKMYALPENRSANFVATLVLVLILLAAVSWGYVITRKTIAASYAAESSIVFDASKAASISKSESDMVAAIGLDNQSDYHRDLAQIELARIQLLTANQSSLSQQDFQSEFQQIFSNAYGQAQAAEALDPSDYQNSVMLGTVAETLVPFNTAGAYDNADKAYLAAQKLNPNNPLIDLLIARLDQQNKDNKDAETYVQSALKLKSNYTDAYYLLAQLQQASGDSTAAVQSLESAYSTDPNDPNLLYELGNAFYGQKDYKDAAAAFNRSVGLAPKYSDAIYMLGLSFYQINDNADAIKAFQQLVTLNPTNKDVSAALARLQSGGDPTIASQSASAASGSGSGSGSGSTANASSTELTASSTATSSAQ
jgi:tetratricopeptide (TPR) repeat protein